MLTISINGNWKLYWGVMPLPMGAEALGLVKRENLETGALIRLSNGNYVQGNAGCIRTLNNIDVENALSRSSAASTLGSIKSDRKAASSAENGKKGGRPSLYDLAHARMVEMDFSPAEMDYIFADWPEGNDHYRWLLSASRDEIADWVQTE